MKPSKNVEDLKNLKKDRTIAKRKHDKAINAVEVLRVKNKQMKKIGKKQSKKLLEKLCNDQDKTGKMFDLLDINVKSIEHLQSLKCGHDALPEGKTFISTSEDMESSIRNNSYVEVAEDFSTKMNRPKGKGYVISSHYLNNQKLFNVKYEEVWGNMLHKNIYMNDITVLSVGHEFNRESIAKSREKRSNEPPTFLDTSPQPQKKENRF